MRSELVSGGDAILLDRNERSGRPHPFVGAPSGIGVAIAEIAKILAEPLLIAIERQRARLPDTCVQGCAKGWIPRCLHGCEFSGANCLGRSESKREIKSKQNSGKSFIECRQKWMPASVCAPGRHADPWGRYPFRGAFGRAPIRLSTRIDSVFKSLRSSQGSIDQSRDRAAPAVVANPAMEPMAHCRVPDAPADRPRAGDGLFGC